METLQIEPKLESKTIDLEEKSQTLYGSCEKSLDAGLVSPKSLVRPDLENKGLKLVKSPVRSDLEFRFVQNLDSEENTARPLKTYKKSHSNSRGRVKTSKVSKSYKNFRFRNEIITFNL